MEGQALNDIRQQLQVRDRDTLAERALRMRFVQTHWPEPKDVMFFGGETPLFAFGELADCFVNGQYIAGVLLAQVVLEHILAGMFNVFGRDDLARAGFQRLSREARSMGWISEPELAAFETLRAARNPYSHSKPVFSKGSLERRVVESDTPPHELIENDARTAIQLVLRLLSRPPFGHPSA